MPFVILALSAVIIVAILDAVSVDNEVMGQSPAGWTCTCTGSGEAKWTIERDETAPSKPSVLTQSGAAAHPFAFKDDAMLKDGFVEVKCKPIAGREDQAAGVVWRSEDTFKDAGEVGVWTNADSVTLSDDFSYGAK